MRGVGTVVCLSIDGGVALDNLSSGEVHGGRRQTSSSFKDRADCLSQFRRLSQESLDLVLVIWVGEVAALDQIIRTQQTRVISFIVSTNRDNSSYPAI